MSSDASMRIQGQGDEASTQPSRIKKPITTDRRIQNRRAQKAYRDRKRERLRELEEKVGTLETSSFAQPSHYQPGNDMSFMSVVEPVLLQPRSDAVLGEGSQFSGTEFLLNPVSDLYERYFWDETDIFPQPKQQESVAGAQSFPSSSYSQDWSTPSTQALNIAPISRGVKGHYQIKLSVSLPNGQSVSASPRAIRECFMSLPELTRHNLRELARAGDFSFLETFKSELKAKIDFRISQSPTQTPVAPARPFCPYANVLHISRLSYFSALFANFSSLGFDFSLFLDEASLSPFSGQFPAGMLSTDVPSALRPIPTQYTIPHHPYIDSLPFPSFRRRALAALSTDPPLLDEDDLCIDLMVKDGLVCWGSTGQGGMDRGTPWESRSWEAKAWFLRKWWWLMGGQESDLWQSSRWWAAQRGERLSLLDLEAEAPST